MILGAILGAVSFGPIINFLQQPDTQFLKTFNPKAWVLAVLIKSVFAIIVYGTTFKKIEKLNFREITQIVLLALFIKGVKVNKKE